MGISLANALELACGDLGSLVAPAPATPPPPHLRTNPTQFATLSPIHAGTWSAFVQTPLGEHSGWKRHFALLHASPTCDHSSGNRLQSNTPCLSHRLPMLSTLRVGTGLAGETHLRFNEPNGAHKNTIGGQFIHTVCVPNTIRSPFWGNTGWMNTENVQ